MPILRTPPPENKPGHFGEFEAFTKIAAIEIPDLELWFNLEFPTVPEIDLIINHPRMGAYIAEIKAMRLDEILTYTPDALVRSDGKNSQQPVKQVKRGDFALRAYLERHSAGERTPYLQKTVIWPRITRAEWNTRFDNPVVQDQVYGMIFSDDLINAEEFESCLATVTANPLGAPVPDMVRKDQPGIEILRRITNYESKIATINSEPDEDVLTAREVQDLKRSSAKSDPRIRKYLPNERNQVMFRGFPGSGKTTTLRDIGIEHARAGNSVLYICFNKVLATKVRQEVAILLAREGIKETLFTVSDQYQFYKLVLPEMPRTNKQALVDKASEQLQLGNLISYDTILLDESQDIDGEFLDFIGYLKEDSTSLFFAYADGQQLYNLDRYPNGKSPQLSELMENSEVQQFNRVFRTGPTSQIICAAVADYYPNEGAGSKWLGEQIAKRTPQPDVLALDFGEFIFEPIIFVSDRPENEQGSKHLLNLVENLIEASRNDQGDIDALIIVSGKGSKSYRDISQYLKLMEIPFADLLQDQNKRTIVPRNAIKIATYQGARGLTSTNTLVLDAGYIEQNYVSVDKPKPNNVFNIALSRATQKTVVYSGTAANDPERPKLATYLESMLAVLES